MGKKGGGWEQAIGPLADPALTEGKHARCEVAKKHQYFINLDRSDQAATLCSVSRLGEAIVFPLQGSIIRKSNGSWRPFANRVEPAYEVGLRVPNEGRWMHRRGQRTDMKMLHNLSTQYPNAAELPNFWGMRLRLRASSLETPRTSAGRVMGRRLFCGAQKSPP
jgi:hypothetical protein